MEQEEKVRCSSCTHFNCYQDGEEEASYGRMELTSLWWEYECGINRKAFDKENPVTCKKYKAYDSRSV